MAGYLMGLHDAGWLGDVQVVRFAYAATSALVGAIGWVGIWMPFMVEQMGAIEELLGHSAAEIAAAWPNASATNSTWARRHCGWSVAPNEGTRIELHCA